MNEHIDPDSNEARLARQRDACRLVHPDVSAARRREAEAQRTAPGNAQEALQVAIGHLNAILNEARTCHQSLHAERLAREWLKSIGA